MEGDRALDVVFLDNEENEASVPDIGFLNRRSQDFKIGYLSWLAGLTEQIYASLDPRLRGGWVTLQFPQVPERYFGHLASQMGCRMHSMRQVPHKKPPFYCPSTRRVSYKVYSLTSFTDALHEQTLHKLNDTAWYSDLQKVEKRSDLSPQEELQAAKNRSFWSTVRNEESSGDLLTKRLTAKASLGMGPGQGRTTREVEVIWWPDLYSTTRNGKLSIRFYIKKVTV